MAEQARRALQLGVLLALLGLLTGLVVPALAVPRLGLSAHACYGGWLMPLLGGLWGAGAGMLPIAAGGARGTAFQEGVIAAGLMTSAVAILAVCGLVLWGRRGPARGA